MIVVEITDLGLKLLTFTLSYKYFYLLQTFATGRNLVTAWHFDVSILIEKKSPEIWKSSFRFFKIAMGKIAPVPNLRGNSESDANGTLLYFQFR